MEHHKQLAQQSTPAANEVQVPTLIWSTRENPNATHAKDKYVTHSGDSPVIRHTYTRNRPHNTHHIHTCHTTPQHHRAEPPAAQPAAAPAAHPPHHPPPPPRPEHPPQHHPLSHPRPPAAPPAGAAVRVASISLPVRGTAGRDSSREPAPALKDPETTPEATSSEAARDAAGRATSRERLGRRSLEPRQGLDLPPEAIPPPPDRLPPFVLNHPHEVTLELDVDWTLAPHDWNLEQRLRGVRNRLIKEELLKHKPVIYRSSGGSLYPRVSSGDQCTSHPVTAPSDVEENDIVFCEVQPGDRLYGHLVKVKAWGYGPPAPYT